VQPLDGNGNATARFRGQGKTHGGVEPPLVHVAKLENSGTENSGTRKLGKPGDRRDVFYARGLVAVDDQDVVPDSVRLMGGL
jgi:hypothetical protein